MFEPAKPRTKYYYKGVSIHRLLNCKEYQSFLRYVKKYPVKEAFRKALNKTGD